MTKTVEQAKTDLEAAKAALKSELEADCHRSEGSGAQERRREEHQQTLRDDVANCEKALADAERSQK